MAYFRQEHEWHGRARPRGAPGARLVLQVKDEQQSVSKGIFLQQVSLINFRMFAFIDPEVSRGPYGVLLTLS